MAYACTSCDARTQGLLQRQADTQSGVPAEGIKGKHDLAGDETWR